MIVVFSRKYPDKVERSVNTLSDILRYMIYDTKQKSKLGHEIMVIEQYLSLQRQRFGEEVEIRTSFDETDKNLMIEPMLLIPIIENAFKHGTSMIKSPVIDISTKSKDGVLYFEVKNKYSPHYTSSLTTYSGLGLANIKRRLDLLYMGKYEFQEEIADGEWFIVRIKIDCR
jgi:sensor histidine kinase YesM